MVDVSDAYMYNIRVGCSSVYVKYGYYFIWKTCFDI